METFTEVVNSEPYANYGIIPENLECISHVQKRFGTQLQNNKVKELKGTKTPFSDKVINLIQNYYGYQRK